MPEKFSVYITQSAQNDLEHIFFYIAADNINNAKKFILELEERINSLDRASLKNLQPMTGTSSSLMGFIVTRVIITAVTDSNSPLTTRCKRLKK